jgi:hypothetical protein
MLHLSLQLTLLFMTPAKPTDSARGSLNQPKWAQKGLQRKHTSRETRLNPRQTLNFGRLGGPIPGNTTPISGSLSAGVRLPKTGGQGLCLELGNADTSGGGRE